MKVHRITSDYIETYIYEYFDRSYLELESYVRSIDIDDKKGKEIVLLISQSDI